MKKFTIFCALLFLTVCAMNAQVTQTNTQFPNPGFEAWSTHSSASGTKYVPIYL